MTPATHEVHPLQGTPSSSLAGTATRRIAMTGVALVTALGVATGAVVGSGGWLASPAAAQEATAAVPTAPGITVVGDGTVRVRPDVTTIRLGIELTAPTPAQALTETRQRSEQVLQRLRERGIPEADLQTGGLNVYPIHAQSRGGPEEPPVVTGYRGNAYVVAAVGDTNQVAPILSAALDAGANSVQGLSFGVRDDSVQRRQALVAAIEDARPKAEAAASATGQRITGVRSVVEVAVMAPPRPLGGGGGGLGMGAASEGIAPGEMHVGVRVQVTYDVAR